MKNVLRFFLFCALLGSACKPEIIQSNGKATAIRNDVFWEAKVKGLSMDEGKTFDARMFNVLDKCPDKVLGFLNISLEVGPVDILPLSSAWPDEDFPVAYTEDHSSCDVVDHLYDLDNGIKTNFLEITAIKGRRIEGIFDLQFANVKDMKDTIRIENGTFSCRLE